MSSQTDSSHHSLPRIKIGWLPVLITILLCMLVGMLWWTLDQRELITLRNKTNAEARYLAGHIDADLLSRIAALQRMADRWQVRGGMPKKEFVSDAAGYVADLPGFQALAWVDRNFIVQWVVPLAGNEHVQGLDLAFESRRRETLERAIRTGSPTITVPVDLVKGVGKGCLAAVPIHVENEFAGFILAVWRLQTWMEHVIRISELTHSLADFRIAVFMDDIRAFEQTGWSDLRDTGLEGVVNFTVMGHRFVVYLHPDHDYIGQEKTVLPLVVAFCGGVLALLVGFIIHLLQKIVVESRETRAARAALELEVREHQKTEVELHQVVSRLEMATQAGGIGVWAWEVETNVLTWNQRMCDLHGIPADAKLFMESWLKAVHPADLPATKTLLENAWAGRAVFETEFRIIHSSGVVRYLAVAARVERDVEGAARRMNGICWDLTKRIEAEKALKEREEQVRLLLNSTGEAIYGIDLHGNCTFANPACLRLLGYAELDQLLGRNMHNLIHHSYADGRHMGIHECSMYRALREGRGIHRDDEVLWRADGSSFPVEYWSYPQVANGEVTGAVVTFIDISERKRTDALLATERQRLAYILEGTNIGTWEWNVQTGATVFNERWAEIIGYTLAELAPLSIETWMRFAHPDDLALSRGLLNRHFNKELAYYECEARMRHKNGQWIWVLDRGKVATWTAEGKPLLMCGTHQDITTRKEAEEKIRHMATHDALTGLPGLRLAKDRLAMAMGQARRNQNLAAVMFIDLDGFKAVNDTLGHEAGDYVLRQVAQRLLACVREIDTVARVGGDEFLVVAAGLLAPENAGEIAEKILRNVTRPLECRGQQTRVGASIGIALYPLHAAEMEQLVKLADEAMYRIKNSGKNNFCYATAAGGDPEITAGE